VKNLKRRDHLKYTTVYGRIILKCTFKKSLASGKELSVNINLLKPSGNFTYHQV
jgi:hypothetical protein